MLVVALRLRPIVLSDADRIDRREAITGDIVATEGLLHAKDRFNAANQAVEATEGLCTAGGLAA
jgi:hypothetical protein